MESPPSCSSYHPADLVSPRHAVSSDLRPTRCARRAPSPPDLLSPPVLPQGLLTAPCSRAGSGSQSLRPGLGRARGECVSVKGHFLWIWERFLGPPSVLGNTCWVGLIRAPAWVGGRGEGSDSILSIPFSPSLPPDLGSGQRVACKQGQVRGRGWHKVSFSGPSPRAQGAVRVHLMCGFVWAMGCPAGWLSLNLGCTCEGASRD